jgi:periplasmic divalent cation tolerance protein
MRQVHATKHSIKTRGPLRAYDRRVVDHYVVTTVTPDRAVAAELAASAVRARLAATAQVHGPVVSFWWHHGEQGEGEEWLAVFKTTSVRYADLEAHLIAGHPWNKPEVTAVKIEAGAADYLRWLETTTDTELGTDPVEQV